MEDQQKQQTESLCEECKENPSKYKCPGCSLRSCSLQCVKAHKLRASCTGKRDRTHFVPLSQFDDNLLLSDYNLLEEMKRAADVAQRTRMQMRAYSQFKLPFYLRNLRNAAASRRTKLLLLPSGMSKREKNQTRYDQRKKFISWTIEWQFHSTDVVLVDHGVHEDTSLCSVIEKHLRSGTLDHKLRKFCNEQLDSLKFFIRKYPKGPKSPFCEMDIKASLKQQLANVVILEYPVVHVFLHSHNYDFEVVKEVHPVSRQPEAKYLISNDQQSPKGITFREEEIEEDNESSNPQVYDLMKNVTVTPPRQIPHHNNPVKVSPEFSNSLPMARSGEGDIWSSNPKSNPGIFGDTDFDFDQGLIDAYSDLMFNHDNFLDLEGVFSKELEEMGDFNSRGIYHVENELEEGEIAE